MDPTTPRRYTRVACSAAAVVILPGETYVGVCENLSVGGAFFKGGVLPMSATVSMTVSLPKSEPIELVGEVRHSSSDGCGIRFTRMPPSALFSICSYVNARH